MQWFFLALALLAALAEFHTGTFYLASIALAAFLAVGVGFSIQGPGLILVFALACAMLLGIVVVLRRHLKDDKALEDFDVGQSVTVLSVAPQGDRLTVFYRGTRWTAVMAEGSAPPPGAKAVISRRNDKLLHLVPDSGPAGDDTG